MSKYLFRGDHADTLHSGVRVEPGEPVNASDVTPEELPDREWLETGDLYDQAHKKESSR